MKLGIIPAVISPFALARIGAGAARRYFVTGERFDAETALRIGLVHEVAEDLDAAVEDVVGELLSAGPQAARWAKRLVRERPDGPETARWIAERRTSDEGQEGLRAFLEKRSPSWRWLAGPAHPELGDQTSSCDAVPSTPCVARRLLGSDRYVAGEQACALAGVRRVTCRTPRSALGVGRTFHRNQAKGARLILHGAAA